MKFLLICVNYHNDAETERFIDAFGMLNGHEEGGLLAVHNHNNQSTSAGSLTAREGRRRNIFDGFPGANLGYFGGAAWGLKEFLRSHPLPEWIIVSNVDIEFPDADFFIKLEMNHGREPPAIIGPNIVLASPGLPSSGTFQNPHLVKRPSRLLMRTLQWITRYYPIYALYEFLSSWRYALKKKFNLEKPPPRSARRIYAPHGAFVVLHRRFFESGGTLEYGSFLYGEEYFLGELARRLNLKVLFDPGLELLHREHSSIGKVSSRRIAAYIRDSAAFVNATYFNSRSG